MYSIENQHSIRQLGLNADFFVILIFSIIFFIFF